MINHNKYNFEIGDWVLLDKKMPLVRIMRFTPNKMFATVSIKGTEKGLTWEVMTNRLEPGPKDIN